MSHEARLAQLAIQLPGPFPPHDPLDAVVVHNGTARTSGSLPRDADGVLVSTGLVGRDLPTARGAECAGVAALNAVSLLRAHLGSLDAIERILTMTVFVACVPDFVEQPAVADGASRVLHEIFGDAGRHTRSAVGMAELPFGIAVEIELVARIDG